MALGPRGGGGGLARAEQERQDRSRRSWRRKRRREGEGEGKREAATGAVRSRQSSTTARWWVTAAGSHALGRQSYREEEEEFLAVG